MLPQRITACILVFFLPWVSFNFNRGICYFYYASGGVTLFDCSWFLSTTTLLFVEGQGSLCSVPRYETKVEIKFSWLTFSYKSWRVNWQICQISRLIKIVLLWGRTTASLTFGKPFGRPKVGGSKYHRVHLSRGISDGFFRKLNKNLPVRPVPMRNNFSKI